MRWLRVRLGLRQSALALSVMRMLMQRLRMLVLVRAVQAQQVQRLVTPRALVQSVLRLPLLPPLTPLVLASPVEVWALAATGVATWQCRSMRSKKHTWRRHCGLFMKKGDGRPCRGCSAAAATPAAMRVEVATTGL
jgi:hypothetical protein